MKSMPSPASSAANPALACESWPYVDAGHAERQQQSERQRRAGVDDRGRAAEGVEEQRQHAEDRAEDVDDDVLRMRSASPTAIS